MRPLRTRYAASKDKTMDSADWEHVRESICAQLEIGMSKGETALDIVTGFICLERQKNLEAIENAVAAALACEQGPITSKGRVLRWKQPLRSSGPSK
jgi:hypothetical protein